MVNKFRKKCCYCKETIEPYQGTIWKWRGRWYGKHNGCSKGSHAGSLMTREDAARERRTRARYSTPTDQPAVVAFYFPSTGETTYQNRNGRCEDAPCCGCCS